MRKILNVALALAVALAAASCSGDQQEQQDTAPAQPQRKALYTGTYSNDSTFIVISKKDLLLTVYAPVAGDTVPVANFKVCLAKNKGQKKGDGDMTTPESEPGKPFKITQIQDASTWCHDFGDGRGSIKAYGNWFLRLETPFKGIGIHGSTNNRESVPGRASEGCIRLLDEDIITLKEKYARLDMPVIIKQEDQGLFPYEIAK